MQPPSIRERAVWLWDSLIDISILHFPVVFGQFDGKDDAGDEEDQAPAEAEPERVLKGGRTRQERGRINIVFNFRCLGG